MSFEIRSESFDQILPVWKEQLWPGRRSAIEPISMIDSRGRIDMSIEGLSRLHPPLFFSARGAEGEVIGVVGTQRTGLRERRLRGLWVAPSSRGAGVGRKLVESVFSVAKDDGDTLVWTMAREVSVPFYSQCGFKTGPKIEAYEFGPHHLMTKSVRQTFAQFF